MEETRTVFSDSAEYQGPNIDEARAAQGAEAPFAQPVAPESGMPQAPVPPVQLEPEKKRFTASTIELICAIISYFAAYIYVDARWSDEYSDLVWHFAVFAGLVVLITELLNLRRKRSAENWIWLGCFVMVLVAFLVQEGMGPQIYIGGAEGTVYRGLPLGKAGNFGLFCVWDDGQLLLFIHGFFVWWVMARSGKLIAGRSSEFLPVDLLNSLILIPFGGFALRIRTIIASIRQACAGRDGKDKTRKGRGIWIAVSIVLCLGLLIAAVSLLKQADRGFAELMDRISLELDIHLDEDVIAKIFLSIPVGMWLFGLMDGSTRFPEERLARQQGRTMRLMEAVRKVPATLWTVAIALFSVFYIIFFAIQGSYLFGAFTRTLPEGFIVSQYAREGFFELCKIMAVNFAVLWLVTRLASEEAGNSKLFKASCLVLLAESMLFAVIALSKLGLYISCFGFTPLRLQSSWLVCVLLAACVLWMVSILTKRKTFRLWMLIAGISLAVLAIV